MSVTKFLYSAFGFSLFTVLCSSPLYADLLTVNCSSVSLHISAASPADSATVTCPLFDPTLGTLQSVSIWVPMIFSAGPGSSMTLQNSSATDVSPGQLLVEDLSFTYGPFPAGVTGAGKSPATVNTTLTAGSIQTVPIDTRQYVLFTGLIRPVTAPLDGFEGPGDLSIPMSVTSERYRNLDPNVTVLDYSYTLNLSDLNSLTLTYDYVPEGASHMNDAPGEGFLLARINAPTPVPEPTTAALAASVLALGFVARARTLAFRKRLASDPS